MQVQNLILELLISATAIYISVWWLSSSMQICSGWHKVRLQVNCLPPTTNLSAHLLKSLRVRGWLELLCVWEMPEVLVLETEVLQARVAALEF